MTIQGNLPTLMIFPSGFWSPKNLLSHIAVDHHDLSLRRNVLTAEARSHLEPQAARLEIVLVAARHGGVAIEGSEPQHRRRRDLGGDAVDKTLPTQHVNVGGRQTLELHGVWVAPELARGDLQKIGRHVLELFAQDALRGFAERHHHDDGDNADDDAEQSEGRAQALSKQREPGHLHRLDEARP